VPRFLQAITIPLSTGIKSMMKTIIRQALDLQTAALLQVSWLKYFYRGFSQPPPICFQKQSICSTSP